MLAKSGMLGFITPATFTYQHYFNNIRKLISELEIRSICKYEYAVFEDADIGDTVSFVVQNKERSNDEVDILICGNKEEATNPPKKIPYQNFLRDDGVYNLSSNNFLSTVFMESEPLGKLVDTVVGIKPYQTGKGTPKQTPETVKNKPFTVLTPPDDSYKQCVIGANFHRYGFINTPAMYLKYGDWLAEPRPNAPFFDKQKIIIRQTADTIIALLDDTKSINLNNVYNVGRPKKGLQLKYILCLLNSSLFINIYQSIAQEKGKLFAEVKKVYLSKLPIKVIAPDKQQPFVQKADKMLELNQQLQERKNKFLNSVKDNFEIKKNSNKLVTFYDYDFKIFLAELKKQKIKLSLGPQYDELKEYFTTYKNEINQLQTQISTTDKTIDQMVYELYDLTEDEIKIVESDNSL